MELNIKNFASIKEASIKIDGITVIAGENNTGKSTIGKILFASFNSLRDIDKKVNSEINYSIRDLLMDFIKRVTFYSPKKNILVETITRRFKLNDIVSNILNDINSNEDNNKENIENIIIDNIREYTNTNDKFTKENIEFLANRIIEYNNISRKKIALNLITKYYNDLFYKQINSRIFKNTNAEIKLNDFGISFEFKNDKCAKFKKNIYENSVFLIDNPFVLDIEDYSYSPSIPDSYLISKIHNRYNKDSILDKTLVEEKLEIIYKMLSNAINGKIIKKENDFYLAFDNITEPISIHNISAGLKSFTIIKMMLEEGILKEKDILVLDEPEIHLHPKWQLLYAEIIVLIQKVFNLHIVITTHSPYFLESIELFTKKHGIDDKTNYYLSDINIKENYSTINLVNDKVYDIYRKMAIPFKYLEKLSDEL
ncbi:AAA family ATPase [Brachyspira aalborgi]|uniref:ATP-binding protein n=1 Tax=Brachyspira aalborgi TaxID=29522 RepID=A0A5C8G8Z0_9SPIR|nr:AAA family ATPase [Brachyspira aalborgi]TXJ58199.1 ATP-binding protein [Brachyspira aalborgi]